MTQKRIFVDGTNLMHARNGSAGNKIASAEDMLAVVVRNNPQAEEIHVVFDGFPFQVKKPSVRVQLHFSLNRSADEVLIGLLSKKGKSPAGLYSGDEALNAKARKHAVETAGIRELLADSDGKLVGKEKPDSESNWQEKLMKLRFGE